MSTRCVRPASQTAIVAAYGSSHGTPSRSTGQVGPRSTCPSMPEVAVAVAVDGVVVVAGVPFSLPQAASRTKKTNVIRIRLMMVSTRKDALSARRVPIQVSKFAWSIEYARRIPGLVAKILEPTMRFELTTPASKTSGLGVSPSRFAADSHGLAPGVQAFLIGTSQWLHEADLAFKYNGIGAR